jgi:hypothetical protein
MAPPARSSDPDRQIQKAPRMMTSKLDPDISEFHARTTAD